MFLCFFSFVPLALRAGAHVCLLCLSGFPPPLLGHGFSRRGRRGLERGGRTWFGMLKVVRQLIGSARVERSK